MYLLADVTPSPVTSVTLSPHIVSFVITLLLPVLIALIYKAQVSATIRGVTLMVLTAVNVLITNAVVDTGQAIISRETFTQWILQLAIAIAMYLGVYRLPGVDVNNKVAPKVGFAPGVAKAA